MWNLVFFPDATVGQNS